MAVADPLVSPSTNQAQNGQQVTAQVAVVQAQDSPSGGQHFITVSGNYQIDDFSVCSLFSKSVMTYKFHIFPIQLKELFVHMHH